jgi:hypothetical protein
MFKGPKGYVLAATYIQKHFKRYMARNNYLKLSYLMKHTRIIQRELRLWLIYRDTKKKIALRNQ